MLSILKSNRCPRCHNNRQIRKCIRVNRDICWQCCNEMRVDSRCPESCAYRPVSDPRYPSPFPAFKADSHRESILACKGYIDLWINKQNEHFENLTPLQYAEVSKDKLIAWLTGFQYPAYFPLDYLLTKLGITDIKSETPPDPEDIVSLYCERIVALEWDKLASLSINDRDLDGCDERYAEIISVIPMLKKMTSFDIIHSGVTEDGSSCFVFGEINHKENWTFLLSRKDEKWQMRQSIADNPQAYYAQNQIFNSIAEAISKAEDEKCWNLVTEALKKYPDCADLYYYRGIYWQMVQQYDKAKVDFYTSISLDNYLEVSYIHLANLNIASSNFAEALYWNSELLRLRPDDPQILNNVAACHASMGDKAKAREIWQGMLNAFPDFPYAKQNLEHLDK